MSDPVYVYLGTVGTDPKLIGQKCQVVPKDRGRWWHRGKALVQFAEGEPVIVVARRLRRTVK
jgi:hypothetical protein